MTTLTFDTLKYAERLKSAGVSDAQARAEAEALRDVLSGALDTQLATKADIRDVRADVKAVEAKLERVEAKLDAKFDKLSWMLGILIALAAANFGKQFF